MTPEHYHKDQQSMADTMAEAEKLSVGYRHPPEASKFAKGQSGNKRGRPRGAKGRRAILTTIAQDTHVLGDGTRKTTLDLVILKIRNAALGGNLKAQRIYHQILLKYEPDETPHQGSYLVVAEEMTLEEWREKYEGKLPPPMPDDI